MQLTKAPARERGKEARRMSMPEKLYVKADRNVEITRDTVYLGDIAKLYCSNEHITSKAKTLKLYRFSGKGEKRQVISILKIIEVLSNQFPGTSITSIGETDTIVERVKTRGIDAKPNILKIAFVSLISLFGTAFTIMAFHNDIGIDQLFALVYEQVMGYRTDDYTILEFFYSLGLSIGIIVFFNHIGARRITKDPTPIEVEMRIYEQDVNTTMIEVWNREGKTIDVR